VDYKTKKKNMSERKSKNVFFIVYGLIVITMLLCSCSTTTQCYNVGTGKPMTPTCGGTGWYGGQ
jgi:hypothetical protein|tara:strand:- start:120 stop:311 length:192 start_codon:yes stop_codon:yes gene_type:complete